MWPFKKEEPKENLIPWIVLSSEDARYFANDLLRAVDEAEDHEHICPVVLYSDLKKVLEINVSPFK